MQICTTRLLATIRCILSFSLSVMFLIVSFLVAERNQYIVSYCQAFHCTWTLCPHQLVNIKKIKPQNCVIAQSTVGDLSVSFHDRYTMITCSFMPARSAMGWRCSSAVWRSGASWHSFHSFALIDQTFLFFHKVRAWNIVIF